MFSYCKKIITLITVITTIIWAMGVPFLTFTIITVPEAQAASVDAINNVLWQSGKDKIAVVFSNWVFNSASPTWGPSSALVPSDFAVTSDGSTSVAVSAVTHDGGSSIAVLTLASAVVDGFTVACAANAVYFENTDVCNGTAEVLGTGGIAATATTFAVSSVEPMGMSLEIEFNHPVATSTSAVSKANYSLLTKDGGIDPYGDAGNATYTALDTAAVANSTNVMLTGWSPNIVRVEAWDADINTSRGNCTTVDAECDKITISTAVADMWGNTLAADSIQSIKFIAGGGAGAPMINGVFVDDDKVVNTATGAITTDTNYDTITIVYSEAMEETTAETASYYTLKYNAQADCDMWNDTEVTSTNFLSNAVVRVNAETNKVRFSVLNATYNIVGQDMSNPNPNVCPSSVRVDGGMWATAGPKDLDGNIQQDDMDRMIEVATSPAIQGATLDGTNLRVNFTKMMDANSIQPNGNGFKLIRAGAILVAVTAASLGTDWMSANLTLASAPTLADGDILTVANSTTDTANAPKDMLGQKLIAGTGSAQNVPGAETGFSATEIDYTFSTAGITAPAITKVKSTDANSNSKIDINDKVAIMFSKAMNRMTAWDPWAFELLGGTNCTITNPSSHSDKANCTETGYWGDGTALSWGDVVAVASDTLDGTADGCDTSGTPGTNNCAVITVGQYSNVKSNMKIVPNVAYDGTWGVADTSGNTVSNVFSLSTASATISNVIIVPILGGGATTLDVNDTVTFFFSKAMDANSIAADGTNLDARMVLDNSHSWGTSTAQWGDALNEACNVAGTPTSNNCLKITLGGSPTIANGDTITPTLVVGTNGNAVSNTWTVQTTGPTINSISGLSKLRIVFSEPVANMNGWTYPEQNSNVYTFNSPQVDLTTLAVLQSKFVYDGTGGSTTAAIDGLDYVSGDGTTFIISLNANAEETDTLAVDLPANSGLNVVEPLTAGATDNSLSTDGYDHALYGAGAILDLSAGAAPTIESVDVMMGGGFGFMDNTSTGAASALKPGSFVRIRFSQSMSMGSITNDNVNTALPITGRTSPWGTAWTNVWWMSEGGQTNNVVEISVGDGATAQHNDTVGPITAVTSQTGAALNTNNNTFVIDTSIAEVSKMTYTDLGTPSISSLDTLVFEFNKSMNTSADGYSTDGCNTTPVTATNLIAEMVRDSTNSWQPYPISAETMGMNWARRNKPFGTTGGTNDLNMVWGKTTSGSCDKLTITFGDSPTIQDGDMIWFDPMWITTQSGKSLLTHDLTLDVSAPTLTSVYLIDSDADSAAGTAGDILYFSFSKPIDQTTISAANIATRLSVAGGDDYGTPTLSWDSPTLLSVTITATLPTVAASAADVVTPTADIKDTKGNAVDIETTAVITAMTSSPVSSVVLTDLQNNTNPGLDKNDMRVSFAEPSDISGIDHYNVYILPSDQALSSSFNETTTGAIGCLNSASEPGGAACHRVNSSDIAPVAASTQGNPSTIIYNFATSAYDIYDDSRFSYLTANTMPQGKNWYPFMPDKSYIAYVVGCLDDTCSTSTMATGSSSVDFVMTMMHFGFDDAMTKMGMGSGAIAGAGTGGMAVTAGGDFWIEGTEPYPGAQDIPTNLTKIGIKFSQPLDENSITYTGTTACPTICLREKNSSTGVWSAVASGVTTSYEAEHFAIILKVTAGTLSANTEYEVKIAGASSSIDESSYGNLIKSDFGMAIPGDYYSNFTVGSGADTTPPQVTEDKFMAEGMDWYNGQAKTGSSTSAYVLDLSTRVLEEVGVRFDKSMDPTTFSSSSMTLKYGAGFATSVSGSVDYDPFDRTAHFWLDSALPTGNSFKLTLSGTLVKDNAGNRLDGDADGIAGGDYTLYFNTTGTMAVTAPTITWGDSDGFWLGLGFSAPMKESTVTNSSNWTLSSSAGAVSLSGVNINYDQFMNELHIDGLNMSTDATYTITANSNVKGLNGTPISTASTCTTNNDGTSTNASCAAFAGTVHGFMGMGKMDCDDAFAFGCSTDDAFHPDVMNFMPIDAWPMNQISGQPSRYTINFPITQAIDHGGKVVLTYPSGFDISGATIANKDTESFMNFDLNGPGTGIVRVRSVTGTATGGSTTTLVDTTASILSSTDDTYNKYVLFMTSGNNKNEYRVISDYVGATKTITLKNAFASAVAANDTYEIQYVERNALKNTITLTIDIDEDEDGSYTDEAAVTSTTMSNDFMGFELKGIVNGSAATMDWASWPPKGGYTIDITTKNSTGKILDGPLISMPFEIKKSGLGVVSGHVYKTDGSTAVSGAKVFLDGPSGHLEKTSGSDGAFRFSGLEVPTNAGEEWYYWLMVEPPATGNYFQGNGVDVRLTSTTTSVTDAVIKLKSGDSTISGKFLHEQDLATSSQKVRIWASGQGGWIDKELTLDGKQATSSSARSATDCDTTGLTTTGFTTPVCTEYIINVLNGEWNVGVEPFFATTYMTMGPPPEPAFTPPASKMVTVSTSKTGVNFNLKSASLSITGTVVDTSGNALSGVEVWAHNSTGMFGFGANSQTKADGTFKLKVSEGLYQVGAMIPGLPGQPEKGINVAASGNTPASLTFTVTKPGNSVNGTIYDENFKPIKYAGVSAFNTSNGMFVPAPANASGVYTLYLANGTWTIEANAPGYGHIKTTTGLEKYTVTIAGASLTGKDFSANGAAQGETAAVSYKTISGQILDSNNTAVEGAVVYAEEVNTVSSGKTGKGNKTVTDSSGNYTIKVPENTSGTTTYTVGAKTDAGELTKKTGIDVSSASVTGQNWSLAEKRAASITLTGVPTGITLDEVKIEAYNTSTMSGKNMVIEDVTSTDNTGSMNLLGGTYDVKANIPGFGQVSPTAASLTSSNYVVSGATTKALEFDVSGTTVITISGTVKNSSATAIENAWVGAFDTGTGIGNDATTDATGAYTLKVACDPSCSYELTAHAAGYLSDKYATAITEDVAGEDNIADNIDITLGTSDAVITGTVYKADGATAAPDAYIYAIEKDGDKKVEAYPDASGQFTLDLDSNTKWNIFAGTEDGKYGTLMNVDSEGASDSDYSDVTFNLSQDIEGFTQVDPAIETVVPTQGGIVSDEAKNQAMLDNIPAVVAANYSNASLDTAGVITVDTIVTIDSGDIGSEDNAYTVMIETLPPLHSLDTGDVLGVEKEVTVLDDDRKEVSDMLNAIDIEMQYDKVDIKNIVDQSADLTTANIGASLSNLGSSYFDAPAPTSSSSEWMTTAATKKVKVYDGTAWSAVDFDTFITNISAADGFVDSTTEAIGSGAYEDFELTIATSMKHLTPLGGILTGTGDALAPSAPSGVTVAATDASSARLTWTAPTTNSDATALSDLQEFVVYRSTISSSVPISGGSEDQRNSTKISSSTLTFTDTITDGSSGYTYYYVVTAYDDNNNQSAASSIVTATWSPSGSPILPSSSTSSSSDDDTVADEVADQTVVDDSDSKPSAKKALARAIDSATATPQGQAYANSTLLKSTASPNVYLMRDGKLTLIPDAATFELNGFRWKAISTVSQGTIDRYPQESTALTLPAGSLVKSTTASKVYKIDAEGKKRWIVSEEVFKSIGYDFAAVKQVSDETLIKYARGDDVVSVPDEHFEGDLVKVKTGSEVYKIENGALRHIPSVAVFTAIGYKASQIVEITSIEKAKYETGAALSLPEGALIMSQEKGPEVYLIYSGKKRLIPDESIFLGLGYKWTAVINVKKTEIEALEEGEEMSL